jgi:WD40 repeat protein
MDFTLKWGKQSFTLPIHQGEPAAELKHRVQSITNVPPSRQKLLCPKLWKGTLNDTDCISVIDASKGKLVVTLVGSADTIVDKPPDERPRFLEDMSPEELKQVQRDEWAKANEGGEEVAIVDIVALQNEVGFDRDDGKMEMYEYNRFVTGLPQHQINDILVHRKKSSESNEAVIDERESQLKGVLAMTMGMELRRAYVNALDVLPNGTLISGYDDGHVQMWRRGQMVKDIKHTSGGVDHVLTIPSLNVDDPGFITAGSGTICIWTEEGHRLLEFGSFPGTSPASIATGSIIGHGNMRYLASCYRVTRQGDPSQFRLAPQNEQERRRRAAAELQESMIQSNLLRASKCVKVWFYGDNVNGVFSEETITPDNFEAVAPTTHLANLNGQLVCGDSWGCVRIFQWTVGNNQPRSRRQSELLQFTGCMCQVAAMESICDNLLAVSIDAAPLEVPLMSSATQLHVASPKGVAIIDIKTKALTAILNAHVDTVRCICPLPDKGILTAGGRFDATVRLWNSSTVANAISKEKSEGDETIVLTEATTLKEPGYVFDLKVLHDSGSSSVFAVASARYNVIKIVI